MPPLTHCFLPLLPSFLLEHEVDDNEEVVGEEGDALDDTNAAAKDIAAADATAANNNGYATMPPKVKPLPRKPTKKESATAAEMPPPPAAAAATTATSFSIDATDPLTAHYYADGVYNYADAVFRVNGMMQKSEYQI